MIVYYLTVAVLALLAVVVMCEVRAELWERGIEREREEDWWRYMRDVHRTWREERLRSDAAEVAETLNSEIREMSLPDWCRFQTGGDGEP